MAKAGAPLGNQNSAKGREGTKALMQALAVASGDKEFSDVLSRYQVMVRMWDRQIEAALDGDKQSLQMIMERTDGKAPQDVNLGGQDGNPVQMQKIVFNPV